MTKLANRGVLTSRKKVGQIRVLNLPSGAQLISVGGGQWGSVRGVNVEQSGLVGATTGGPVRNSGGSLQGGLIGASGRQ